MNKVETTTANVTEITGTSCLCQIDVSQIFLLKKEFFSVTIAASENRTSIIDNFAKRMPGESRRPY